MIKLNLNFLHSIVILTLYPFFLVQAEKFHLPEIYQDIYINGKIVQNGVRSCNDRYEAIKPILESLTSNFKVLDIGACQGYFSFRMAEEFGARCTMIEDNYAISNKIWHTGDYLHYLCEKNAHLKNITLLKQKVFLEELINLKKLEEFDVVIAFSVIHHMRKSVTEPYETYSKIIDVILDLAPVVLIENPINTGEHTFFIRKVLQEKRGRLVYTSPRGTLTYEIYLFDKRKSSNRESSLPNISNITYKLFNGCYNSFE